LIHKERSYNVEVCRGDHRLVSWSYAIIEKPKPAHARHFEVAGRGGTSLEVVEAPPIGRTVVYTGDTRPSEEVTRLATGVDLLIHESTFADDLIERAKKDGHSTFSQAAEVAVRARVKRLILTHISSRYSDVALLLEAALKIFPNTMAAKDLLEIEV
jgi:ribonuclease Z